MPRTRPPSPPEFRREAVRMVRYSGRPISEADRRLFPTWEAARTVIFEYIEGLYNRGGGTRRWATRVPPTTNNLEWKERPWLSGEVSAEPK